MLPVALQHVTKHGTQAANGANHDRLHADTCGRMLMASVRRAFVSFVTALKRYNVVPLPALSLTRLRAWHSLSQGDESMVKAVTKMVGVWEERRVFGSGKSIKARGRPLVLKQKPIYRLQTPCKAPQAGLDTRRRSPLTSLLPASNRTSRTPSRTAERPAAAKVPRRALEQSCPLPPRSALPFPRLRRRSATRRR